MKLMFLEGSAPFTKTITRDSRGDITKDPYPHFFRLTSHEVEVDTIESFYSTLEREAELGRCLQKGLLMRPVQDESRRALTLSSHPTEWMVLDFDGLSSFNRVRDIMEHLGLGELDHIIQYSASHGLSERVHAHVFVLLDRPVAPDLLKQWMMQKNLDSERLRAEIHLYKSKIAHSWPLDISCAQNDKLIYIAAPIFKGMADPVELRIELVKRKHRRFVFPSSIESLAGLRRRSRNLVNELRAKEGLAAARFALRLLPDGTEIALANETCSAELRDCGDYWRLNLNGGDSWGYWIDKDEPRILRNFKGEPNYYTEQLLPELYAKLIEAAGNHALEKKQARGYLDEVINLNGTIHCFRYDLESDVFSLTKVSNNTVWKHYLIERGINVQNYVIREWKFAFEPDNELLIDPKARYVNTFRPTEYMLADPRPDIDCPPVIKKVILHAVGNELFEHFINWLAFIFQKKTKTGTAWLLQGIHGTGKGVIFHKVLSPLFGRCAIQVSQGIFSSRFNDFLDERLVVNVDEVDFSTDDAILRDVMNKITENTIAVERKFNPIKVIPNRCNFILNANRLNPVLLAVTDRRFNVGHRQTVTLGSVLNLDRISEIDRELPEFASFLMGWAVDERAASMPKQTAAKNDMQTLSQTTLDEVIEMLNKGKLEYFIDHYVDPITVHNRARADLAAEYASLLQAILNCREEVCNLSRDAIRTLVYHCCGIQDQGEAKFTRMLAHHGLALERARPFNMQGVTRPCARVKWRWDAKKWREWVNLITSKKTEVVPLKSVS